MNIYLVVSEELAEWMPSWELDPPERYRICEVVVARNHSQARWLAWKTDGGLRGTYTGDPRDMPRFTVQQKKFNYGDGPAHVMTDDEIKNLMNEWPWFSPWQVSKAAPHIGLEEERW